MPRRPSLLAALVFLSLAPPALALEIDRARGADPRVDYAALATLAPWDDRNYNLTREDLALLPADEAGIVEAIPLFFRVELRREIPDLPATGPVRYPRSALPAFLLRHGGFLIDGKLHKRIERTSGGRLEVAVDAEALGYDAWLAAQAAEAAGGEVGPSGEREEFRVVADAAETAIAFHPTDDRLVVAGSNGPGSYQRMHRSTDGGKSWAQVELPGGNACCDPTVSWSSDGSKAYAATLGWTGSSRVWIYRSGDQGASWSDLPAVGGKNRREIGSAGADKEYLHVDVHPGSPCLDDVYIAWQESGVNKLSRSIDQAVTWEAELAVSSTAAGEAGFGSDLASDKSGHLYYFWPTFDRRIVVRKSTDCGATLQPTVEVADTEASYAIYIPAIESRGSWTYVTAAADRTNGPHGGTLYVAWTDTTAPEEDNDPPAGTHALIRVARSTDGGAHWTVSIPHSMDDLLAVDRWNPWIGVGPDGVVHAVFYDTRAFVDRSGVDLYRVESRDGGATWSTPERLTTVSSPNIGDSFEFGDYNGFDVSVGNFLAIFTDNRVEAGPPGASVDAYVAGTLDGIFADDFEFGSPELWSETEPPLP